MFQNNLRRRYTWRMLGAISRYQIDILVRKRPKYQVKYSKAYPGADCNSDHNLVVMKYIKTINMKVLKDNKICKEYRRHILNR